LPTILALCRDYYYCVKPQGLSCQDNSSELTGHCSVYQKKIKDWWLNPTKLCHLFESEQQKHPGKCLYHLTKSYQTSNCTVKKECDRLVATKQTSNFSVPSSSNSPITEQLRHVTEESYEDAIEDVSDDVVLQDTSNDTNDEVLHYFACVTNHYLCLVKGDSSLLSRHKMKYPIIEDSGAYYHMFKEIEFFTL
jgi:hypothetical protein